MSAEDRPTQDFLAEEKTIDHIPIAAPRAEGLHAGAGSAQLRYKAVQFHARGALGEVLLAQDAELNRSVALKRIQGQYADDPASRRRFLREAEVTGRLEHPGVVPVYGLVHDADGRPCYAMRFIEGESLQEAIERFHATDKPGRDPGERRLALRQLLTSFVTTCKTMAYAHSRGIVHRDLKPANIMLGKFGETLVVDWGLARSFERDESAPSRGEEALKPARAAGEGETRVGQMVGTPAYCSPEQASGQWDVVGPASDIFSLGAVLYNLLTNRLPYAGPGVLELIAQASTGEVIPPRKRNKEVPRSLEAICLKAMARQPDARYGTALDLAADVEHWLADEPIAALREPALVRAGRWLRKHRPLVAGLAAAAAVALVSLTVVLVVVAGKNGELRLANQREAARAEAERLAKDEAEKRLVQIEKGTDILGSIFADLDPHAEEKEGKPLREILGQRVQRAAKELEGESIADALTVAKLQHILGLSLAGLGHYTQAAALLEKASATRAAELGDDDADTVQSRNNLALAYQDGGQVARAISLLEQTLQAAQVKLGEDHADTLQARNNLALAYQAGGELDRAIPLLEGVLRVQQAKLGDDHPETLKSRNNLAVAYKAAGQLDRAIPLLQGTLQAIEAQMGVDHPDTASARNNLAQAYQDAGQLDQAIPRFERALKTREAKLGADHPHTLSSRNNLASAYKAANQLDRAIPLWERTLKASETQLGTDHPETLTVRNNLALAYLAVGKWDLGMPLLERNLQVRQAKLGDDHPDTLQSRNNLARAYRAQGKLDLAIPLFERTLKACEIKLGDDHPHTLTTRNNLAGAYQEAGQLDRAFSLFEKVVPQAQRKLGLAHPLTMLFKESWLKALEADRQYSRAVQVRNELLRVQRKTFASDDPRLATALAQLGHTLLAAQKPADAEPVLRECLTIRSQKEPDAWTTFNTHALLGGALLGQKKYAEAEPLLVHGYQGMKQRVAKIPPASKNRLTEALTRLVQLHEATGKSDEAAKWRKELDASKTGSDKR
jgi:tetratricopeptide (TPR) repeat protein/tRNA A-37 threonylcarbamoyl transferase component Bud32